LLGIALALQHSPSRVRTLQFAEDARRWRQAVSADHTLETQLPKEERGHRARRVFSRTGRVFVDKTRGKKSKPQKSPHVPPLDVQQASLAPSSSRGVQTGRLQSLKRFFRVKSKQTSAKILKNSHGYSAGTMPPVSSGQVVENFDQAPAVPANGASLPAPLPDETTLVEITHTRFGGVFYLLNLALLLGFYADFSAPLSLGLALSPWDFLALVGRELAGPELETDPLWPLLARLAGRGPEEPPGQGFEPPDGLSLAEWQRQTALQVRLHLLVAFPQGHRDDVRLEQESALGALLFEHAARIEASSSRLDIFFSLARHPIQIRLAGLDRDPWWIPAAGRYVVYHYD